MINLQIIKGLRMASRAFPYGRFLITVFPFFAVLFHAGLIDSFYSVTLILPFVTMMVAGYIYNTLCDADKDPEEKNPVTRGDISRTTALLAVIFATITSLIIFRWIYVSNESFLLFIIYAFFWLAYSGLKIRFKETILGPIVASIVLFAGAPFILLLEFNYLDISIFLLGLGILFVYLGHEIKHTLLEYDLDKSYDCKTFAVITGKKNSALMEYTSLFVGFLLLFASLYYMSYDLIMLFIFGVILLISLGSTISYGSKLNYDLKKDVNSITIPYIITKIFIIIYACLVLDLPVILIFFIIWILFIDRYL